MSKGFTANLSLDIIDADPKLNVRSAGKDANLKELEESIKEKGILVPLIIHSKPGVEKKPYELVCGFRRYRAAQNLGLGSVPCIVKEGLLPEEIKQIRLVENLQRSDLGIFEEGEAFKRLAEEHSMSLEDIAEKVGKTRTYIQKRLLASSAPEELKKAVEGGKIKLGQLLLLAGIENIQERKEMLSLVVSGRWGVKELNDRLSNQRVIDTKTPFDIADCLKCPFYGGTQRKLLLDEGNIKGRMDYCQNKQCFNLKTSRVVEEIKQKALEKKITVVNQVKYLSHDLPVLPNKFKFAESTRYYSDWIKDKSKCETCEKRRLEIAIDYEGRIETGLKCTDKKCKNLNNSYSSSSRSNKEEMARRKKQAQAYNNLVLKTMDKIKDHELNRLLLKLLFHSAKKSDPMTKFIYQNFKDVLDMEKMRKVDPYKWRDEFIHLMEAQGKDRINEFIKAAIVYQVGQMWNVNLKKLVPGDPKPKKKKGKG